MIGLVVGLTTSVPGMVALPQDTPAAILALAVGGIALAMKSAQPQAVFATALAAIAVTSLLVGVIFLLLGRFRLSGFVRYIPYPVVGGFLAGTGWLLAKGGVGVMVNIPLTLANLPRLFSAEMLILWLPGLIFGVALLLVLRRYKHFLITLSALVLVTALFYGYLWIAHISVADASARGWLLGPFPAGGFYQPLTPATLAQVDWRAVFGQADKMATILVLSVIALLLNTSGLEITAHQDIDLNRELMTAGFANLAGGLGGSTVGYQTLGMSALAYRLGARSRMVSVIAGLVCGAALLFGASLFSYVPKLLLGGMLLYLGLTFLVEWLVDARRCSSDHRLCAGLDHPADHCRGGFPAGHWRRCGHRRGSLCHHLQPRRYREAYSQRRVLPEQCRPPQSTPGLVGAAGRTDLHPAPARLHLLRHHPGHSEPDPAAACRHRISQSSGSSCWIFSA